MPSLSDLDDTYLQDGNLLRPEPVAYERDGGGGVLLVGLIFAGLTVFAVSANDIRQVADNGSTCPVAVISYCDHN